MILLEERGAMWRGSDLQTLEPDWWTACWVARDFLAKPFPKQCSFNASRVNSILSVIRSGYNKRDSVPLFSKTGNWSQNIYMYMTIALSIPNTTREEKRKRKRREKDYFGILSPHGMRLQLAIYGKRNSVVRWWKLRLCSEPVNFNLNNRTALQSPRNCCHKWSVKKQ